jgi:hypothetical protein
VFPFRIKKRFDLRELNDVGDKEQYQVKVSMGFTALESSVTMQTSGWLVYV